MTIAVLLVLLAATAFALWRVGTEYVAHLKRDNIAKTNRVADLEGMIDQVRADRAGVAAPANRREVELASMELHEVLQGNLDMIEDDEARTEYESLIRARLASDPKTDPVRLAAEIFGR